MDFNFNDWLRMGVSDEPEHQKYSTADSCQNETSKQLNNFKKKDVIDTISIPSRAFSVKYNTYPELLAPPPRNAA